MKATGANPAIGWLEAGGAAALSVLNPSPFLPSKPPNCNTNGMSHQAASKAKQLINHCEKATRANPAIGLAAVARLAVQAATTLPLSPSQTPQL